MLSLLHRLPEAIDRLKDGQAKHADLVGHDLASQTITVIGTGRIGRHVIHLAKAFGAQVLGVDPYPQPAAAKELDFTYVGLHEGLQRANIVTLHAPATPDNHHLLNRHSLAALPAGAMVINTARGDLINTTALLHALHTGHLGGAALDTIEGEAYLGGQVETTILANGHAQHQVVREIAEHEALLRLPNVILTNHNAYNTAEAHNRITADAVKILNTYLDNLPVHNLAVSKAGKQS